MLSLLRLLVPFLVAAGMLAQAGQPVPPSTPPAPPAAQPAAQPPVPTGQPAQPGQPAQTGQDPQPAPPAAAAGGAGNAAGSAAAGETANGGDESGAEPKPPRPGIPCTDPVVHTHCARCHALDERQHMTRISYVRKSPEGWAESIKRMGRLHGLQLSPTDAKEIVRSLANSHGLTRDEAARGLYESERRVHWSEDHHDQDFKRACAQCHPLGRVLLQQRDEEEWQLLRATHVAMFPLAQGQMGGGPPEEERRRGGNAQGGQGGSPTGGSPTGGPSTGGSSTAGSAGGGARGGANTGRFSGGEDGGGRSGDVGDRVLQKLASEQPLLTPAWQRWQKNRREVPLAGTWTVTGHETGRGDLFGTATLTRSDTDEYEVRWQLQASDGSTISRVGKGILYAGYSWRGRAQEQGAGKEAPSWREVLLLDDAWQTLQGRLFTGHYDELGADVVLHRDRGQARVLAVGNGAIAVPSDGHVLELHGEAFPAAVAATDLFVGEGLTVTKIERASDRRLLVTVAAAAGTELGSRAIAFGSDPHGVSVQLYDTVDYVRIRPLRGLSRIGGLKHPKQMERFEAYAVHQGPDGKPYTADDVDLFQVRPRWGLAEFRVRENDDDVQYVGSIDASTGVFTPNVDGPNQARKWQANNIGDVFVTASVELEVATRPAPAKATDKQADKPADKPADDGAPTPGAGQERAADKPEKPPAEAVPASGPVVALPTPPPQRSKKTFTARSHLIVTVPLYARWQVLEWEER